MIFRANKAPKNTKNIWKSTIKIFFKLFLLQTIRFKEFYWVTSRYGIMNNFRNLEKNVDLKEENEEPILSYYRNIKRLSLNKKILKKFLKRGQTFYKYDSNNVVYDLIDFSDYDLKDNHQNFNKNSNALNASDLPFGYNNHSKKSKKGRQNQNLEFEYFKIDQKECEAFFSNLSHLKTIGLKYAKKIYYHLSKLDSKNLNDCLGMILRTFKILQKQYCNMKSENSSICRAIVFILIFLTSFKIEAVSIQILKIFDLFSLKKIYFTFYLFLNEIISFDTPDTIEY